MYVPSLAANSLYVYQMTHTSLPKRVVFEPDTIEISYISTGKMIAKGVENHASKAYEFSHFFSYSHQISLLSHEKEMIILQHDILFHLKFTYLQHLQNEKIVEGLHLMGSSQGICKGFSVGKSQERNYDVGKERRDTFILDLIHSDVS